MIKGHVNFQVLNVSRKFFELTLGTETAARAREEGALSDPKVEE